MTAKQAARTALESTPRPETRPKLSRCQRCMGPVLIARTVAGLDVEVGAAPLSVLGELAATMAGRSTYTWHLIPDHLVRRYPLVIQSRPAGTPRQTVHATHACGDDWPALPPAAVAAAPTDDAPPY